MPREGGLRTVPPHKPLVSPPRVVRLDGGTRRPHQRRGGHHVPPIHSHVWQGPPPDPPGDGLAASQASLRRPRLSGVALAQSPPPDSDSVTLFNRDRQLVERKKGGRLRGPPHLQPADRRPLLRHPPPRHRRLAHQHLPGQGRRKAALRGLGVHLRVPRPWTSSPSFTPNSPTCWCWPYLALGGGDHHVFHALIPVHQPNGLWDRVLGALDPDPLGQGRSQVGDPRCPRDPLRRGAEDFRQRPRRVPGEGRDV